MDRPAELPLLTLGGSLLPEKTEADAARPAVLARLAAEIAESAAADGTPPAAGGPAAAGPRRVPLVLAHGSGSLWDVAPRPPRLPARPDRPPPPPRGAV